MLPLAGPNVYAADDTIVANVVPFGTALHGERLRALAPGGRQLELHLVDVLAATQVDLRPLWKGAGALPVTGLVAVGQIGHGERAVGGAG